MPKLRALLICTGALVLAACAHAPAGHPLPSPPVEPPPGVVPPAEPSSTYPDGLVPPAAQATEPADATLTETPTQVAGLTPTQYSDLFDRLRSGFKLDEVERAAVDQQVNWYASHPAYLERAFGRAELYLYHIVTELEARGMPLEIALLPVVESAFEPYAYSRARASGLWQFIPGTGSRYGLKQDWWYDGRRDVVESTRAALDYLQSLHDEFNGDWLLAIAAYNCGEYNVERALEANRQKGKPLDFWSLKLPKETQAYVPKLLAMRRLVVSPETYGISISPIPNQPYFARVETHGQIDLKLAAEIAGCTDEELYELNPAFHRWATDPAGPHYLLLPVDGAQVFTQNVALLSDEQRMRSTIYTVGRGDSVASVAKRFNTTPAVIREMNDLPTGPLTLGTDLRVPSSSAALPSKVLLAAARVDRPERRSRRPHVHIVHRGDTMYSIARRSGMNVQQLAMLNNLQPGDPLRAGQRIRVSSSGTRAGSGSASTGPRRVTYTVRHGDTLAAIARLFQVSVNQIMAWNGIASRSGISPGQKLTIHVVKRG
ncbi:MAG: LysM peptidoglycan-binding domain-containing protein [Sinobacteraceae bacterium]|nr:LysM peptidoglycan-binding domain-containing protein [Nevskiaceae bacterium]MBV9911518.1 LysM peptidoglycan-binding domain-containing protein [Nevskiaceae bacterium]